MPFSPFNVYNYTKYPLTNEKTQLQKLILLSFLCHFTPSVSILCMYSIKLQIKFYLLNKNSCKIMLILQP